MPDQLHDLVYGQAAHRYRTDPAFHQIVDVLTKAIEEMHLTPGEVREAAMLAAIHFEMRNPSIRYYMREID